MARFRDFLQRHLQRDEDASALYKWARRVVVAVIGSTVLLLGLAMIVLPGPATVMIPAGLAILGLEFVWARRFLRRLRDSALEIGRRVTSNGRRRAPERDSSDGAEPRDKLTA